MVPEYDVWWRTEVLTTGRPDCASQWQMDDDHDTLGQAERRKARLESHGRTARVRKMRGLA
jgi:hypothetical protein